MGWIVDLIHQLSKRLFYHSMRTVYHQTLRLQGGIRYGDVGMALIHDWVRDRGGQRTQKGLPLIAIVAMVGICDWVDHRRIGSRRMMGLMMNQNVGCGVGGLMSLVW